MKVNIKEYRTSELKELLITCDGQGKIVKGEALEELLKRQNQYNELFSLIDQCREENLVVKLDFGGSTWGEMEISDRRDNPKITCPFLKNYNSISEAIKIIEETR
jgi:hypothetical protein